MSAERSLEVGTGTPAIAAAPAGSEPLVVRPSAESARGVLVHPGPRLLAGIASGPGLDAHRARHGAVQRMTLARLLDVTREADVRGRGGAGFPFATKLEAAASAGGRPTVVVNLSEGEPASFKDAALALTAPHLVLDGAQLVAGALGAGTVHLVLPGEHAHVGSAVGSAVAERRRAPGRRLRWRLHVADRRFVAGQARAVVELLSGRPNLPVTAWQPEAVAGLRGRPTLLSNAETFAQVAVLAASGGEAPLDGGSAGQGTRLLTIAGDGPRPEVLEVAHGEPWAHVLTPGELSRPVLLGGYHGTWATAGALAGLTVSAAELAERGLTIGAGVVLPLDPDDCPVHRTARITEYLAGQSARRCGPCLNGLPALADAVWAVHRGHAGSGSESSPVDRARRLGDVVERRGACAHPDGTIRLVRSMLDAFPDEVAAHARDWCTFR